MSNRLKIFRIFLLFFILSIVFSYTFFTMNGYMSAHDIQFHTARAYSLTNFFSHPVNFTAYTGGIPIAQFYPSLTIYPLSFLFLFKNILGFFTAYKIYLFFLTLFNMYICYFVGKRMKDEKAGVVFAITYTFASYRVINLFVRLALGELVAMTILPLVIYGLYELILGNKKKWYILAISMTLLFYSHLLMTLCMLIFLIIFSAIYYKRFLDDRERIIGGFCAAGLSFLLSLGFIIPFIQQMYFQEIFTTYEWYPTGEKISRVLEGIAFNKLEIFTPGLLVAGILAFLAFNFKKLTTWQKVLFSTGVVCLIFTTDMFPWWLFYKTPLKSLQFSWRFNTFVSLFGTCGFSLYVSEIKQYKKILYSLLVIVPILHIYSYNYFINNPPSNYPVWEMKSDAELAVANGGVFYLDYVNTKIHISEDSYDTIPYHKYFLNGNQIHVTEEVTPDAIHVHFFNSQGGATLQLPIYRYLGQIVMVNGKEIDSTLSEKGLTQITLPSGEIEIVVTYRYTILSLVAMFVSFVTSIGLGIYLFKFKANQKNYQLQSEKYQSQNLVEATMDLVDDVN